MQNLIISDIPKKIVNMINNSDRFMSRILVEFVNGYQLSIIRGDFSYGGASGLFEIAIIDNFGNFCTNLMYSIRYGKSLNDNVIGWLDECEVRDWAIYIANLPIMEAME